MKGFIRVMPGTDLTPPPSGMGGATATMRYTAGEKGGVSAAAVIAGNMRNYNSQAPLDGAGAESRIVLFEPNRDPVEIAKRGLGIDDFHALRSLVSAVSTCWSTKGESGFRPLPASRAR